MTPRQNKQTKILTETELELMNILWRLGGGTVNDVSDQLPKDRKLAYTSVSTILRILEQKQILGVRKQGRGHTYYPKIAKAEYERTSVNHLVAKVFEGEVSTLVKRLVETKGLSQEELTSIKEIFEERLKNESR